MTRKPTPRKGKMANHKWDRTDYVVLDAPVKRCVECGRLKANAKERGKAKSVMAYVTVSDNGKIYPNLIEMTRSLAIQRCASNKESWRHLRSFGYRCVRVEIKEVKK